MRKIFLVASFILVSFSVHAQQGIRFEHNLNWAQVQREAKSENKYIFLDCFATWCGPCKLMEQQVYSNDTAGSFFNAHFISVKVQLDDTPKDDAQTQAWHADAASIQQTYQVNALPTFLFFSPDGKLAGRGVGFQATGDFVKLAVQALQDSKSHYDSQLALLKQGKLDYNDMPALIPLAFQFGDQEAADSIRRLYLTGYLYKLDDSALYTKQNLLFIASAMQSTHEKGFDLFFKQGARIDRITGQKGLSKDVVYAMISKQEVEPVVTNALFKTHIEPDWKQLDEMIRRGYGRPYAKYLLLNAKVWWYRGAEDWPHYLPCAIEQAERDHLIRLGLAAVMGLNDVAWAIFQHSTDKKDLEKALAWSSEAVRLDPKNAGNTDTKANILYKLGRKDEALKTEMEALSLSPGDAGFKDTLEKMKKNEPTW